MENDQNAKNLKHKVAQPTSLTEISTLSKIAQQVEEGVLIKYVQTSDVSNVKQQIGVGYGCVAHL